MTIKKFVCDTCKTGDSFKTTIVTSQEDCLRPTLFTLDLTSALKEGYEKIVVFLLLVNGGERLIRPECPRA